MSALFCVSAAAVGAMMKGAWIAPEGKDVPAPGGYDMYSHFAGEPAWYRAKYHGPGMNSIPPYSGDPAAKYKMFTVCGDSCVFNADFMNGTYLRNADQSPVPFSEMTSTLKQAGYNGIIYDFELFDYIWTQADNDALNNVFQLTKANGMYSAWTTAAMGPFQNGSSQSVPIDIDWQQLDFVMPEMYDATQNYLHNGLKTYAPWWKTGGLSIHNYYLKSGVGNTTLVLWGASVQAAGVNSNIGEETYAAAYNVTGLPGGFMAWTYGCKAPC
eukprot:TRINITY_DN40369_c0_g1_i1.p1 TRINITY_DN40369_c0_g1~~TRINITY_DN40369_c0_g1_i1.p1  ORF type:complete len:279 (+),score=101.70 TRINITY_DN40369_c0_g1_i1:30-839(+)